MPYSIKLQVYVQTDNRTDDECQTNEIEYLDKWTQCPAHDYKGYGGKGFPLINGTPNSPTLMKVKLAVISINVGH